MSTRVHLNTILSQYAGGQLEADVDGNTIGQCLEQLVKKYPRLKKALFDDEGQLLNIIEVYINSESAYPDELARPVKPGDELHILFAVDGG
ncbi:MAG: MoaD/ThiS family protein [Chloroflexota bacterium]